MDNEVRESKNRRRRYRGHIDTLNETNEYPLLPNLPAIFDNKEVPTNVVDGDMNVFPEQFTCFNQFRVLDPIVLRNLRAIQLDRPTVTQKYMIQHIYCSQKDVFVQATSRTGKTYGYTLPVIAKIGEWKVEKPTKRPNSPYAIVIVPTKTLGYQTYRDISLLTNGSSVSCAHALGGVSMRETSDEFKRGCDIVVGTPGRVCHLIEENRLLFHNLRFMVYDEADEIFLNFGGKGMDADVHKIINELKAAIEDVSDRPKIRSIFCSATFTAGSMVFDGLVFQPDYRVNITIGKENVTPNYIKHNFIFVQKQAEKSAVFAEMLPTFQSLGQTIVFVNRETETITNAIFQTLSSGSYVSHELRADNYARENLRAITEIRDNVADFLVSTRIGARGLNFPSCRCVVNYEIPRDRHDLLNRLSRCALAGSEAITFTFFAMDTDFSAAPWLCQLLEDTNQPVPVTLKEAADR
ncbi:hypothetical protein M3Y94_01295900 [Aphelenchoides besseyi]|nr:hypothetical protein M3Y94_01295900 [Aphelenchoides besseyi]KAI6217621.1 hypothetical protein M3Y95_01208800 [Aphelenchoides besseyi]